MEMVLTRKKERAGENPESCPRTQPETNIRDVRATSQTVFTQEQNELFVQQVVQYSQDLESEDLHYHVIGLNEYSTEDDMKKAYSKLALQSHPDKNKHLQASSVMRMINEAKGGLEDLLRYNIGIYDNTCEN